MRRRTIIKNEPRIISGPSAKVNINITDINVPWGIMLTQFIIPVVLADTTSECPPPPKLKYTDLPMYDNSLDDTEEERRKSQEYYKDFNQKIIHRKLNPYITEYRKEAFNAAKTLMDPLSKKIQNIINEIVDKKIKFKEYMRHPDHLQLRTSVVASGTAAGIAFGSKNSQVTRSIFWGTIGALFAGWLCFPKETDIAVRQMSYNFATVITLLLGVINNKTYRFEKEKLPCFEKVCVPVDEYYMGSKDCNKKKEEMK